MRNALEHVEEGVHGRLVRLHDLARLERDLRHDDVAGLVEVPHVDAVRVVGDRDLVGGDGLHGVS
jgi:hypothetical protein